MNYYMEEESKKLTKKQVIRNIALILVVAILVTSIASYLATGASITANAPVVDASSAAENYLAENTEYVQQNRVDRAKTLLQNALSGFSDNYNSHYNALSVAIANQKYEEALTECEACLALIDEDHQNYLDLMTKKGCLEALLGKYPEATESFKKVIAVKDDMAQAHLLLAELYLEQADVEGATEHLVKYSELAPDDNSQLAVICELYYGQNDYQKAIEYGEKALKSGYEPDMDLYNAIGLSKLLTGDYKTATGYFDKAIACGEKESSGSTGERAHAIASLGETYYYRGLCRLTLEQYEDAISDYDKAIELGYQTSLAYYNRGVCKLQLEDYFGCYDDMKVVVGKGDEPEITEIAQTLITAIDDAKNEAEAQARAQAEAEMKAQAEAGVAAEAGAAAGSSAESSTAVNPEDDESWSGEIENDLE